MSQIFINSFIPGGIVKDGLVLHLDAAQPSSYPGSGTTWTDLSGNGNNGTLTNGPTYSSANGGSIVFDGSNDYVNGVHNTQLNITGDITVECWFRLTNTRSDWVRVFGKGGNTDRTFGLWYNQSISVYLYQRYGASDMNTGYIAGVSLNTWYHMVGTSSSNSHKLYLNGVVRGSSNTGTTFASSTAPYTVGYGNINTYHIGNIPKVSIYNRALTAAEIAQNYNALKSRYGL